MTSTLPSSQAAPPGRHRHVHAIADLAAIAEPGLNLVCWHRSVQAALRQYAAETLAASDLNYSAEVAVDGLMSWRPAGLPAGGKTGVVDEFVADLRFLATVFADLTGASRLGFRLLRLRSAMCPRFHTDLVGVRLLTTYCGIGTEWLGEADVDRRWLGEAGHGRPDASSGVLRTGAVIQQVPEFAVALLKGDAWPGNEGWGAVHRSPRPQRQPRVLFSLDVLTQDGSIGTELPRHEVGR